MKKRITVGIDLGDKKNDFCTLNESGKVERRGQFQNSEIGWNKFLMNYKKEETQFIMEAGVHSPWVSRLLKANGYTVVVGNSRDIKMVWASKKKTDKGDAEALARLGNFDESLLHPITHRGKKAWEQLCLIRNRELIVKLRTQIIQQIRSLCKNFGVMLPKVSTPAFAKKVKDLIPNELQDAMGLLLVEIEHLSSLIKYYDKKVENISEKNYPETKILRQVNGVGPITALTYVLTIEDPNRFSKSRTIGSFLGLTPRKDQSGKTDKQCRITKAGDHYLRTLLVGAAQYIIGPFGQACTLRDYGLKLAERGGKSAKKRAVVAVARRLAVMLHSLWNRKAKYLPYPAPKEKIEKVA